MTGATDTLFLPFQREDAVIPANESNRIFRNNDYQLFAVYTVESVAKTEHVHPLGAV